LLSVISRGSVRQHPFLRRLQTHPPADALRVKFFLDNIDDDNASINHLREE